MKLRYRVVVVRNGSDTFEAQAPAFPSLHVSGATPRQAIDAARDALARLLAVCAREGRRPPAPDEEAVAIELVAVAFENTAQYRPNVQVDVMTGKIHKDGEEVSIRGTALALIVSLATEARDTSTEVLCERLYPGISGDQAYSALKMCVSRSRKQIGLRSVIETTERGYRLSENVVLDIRFLPQIVRAVRTRSVAKAIETRLAAIFEQLAGGRPAAYAGWEWFAPVERTLRSSAREIGMYLAERALRDADTERVLDIAQQLAALDPLDETAHELAIRVHLTRGDRASALHTYRRYAEDLHAQHGMEPSPALRAMVEVSPA